MAKWRELGDEMKIALPVDLSLCGGSVLVQVAEEVAGKRLTSMVTELIQSREGRFGMIGKQDIDALTQVQHELRLAADLLGTRIELERDRSRARGEAL